MRLRLEERPELERSLAPALGMMRDGRCCACQEGYKTDGSSRA